MTAPLAGLAVVVLRPGPQAGGFAALVREAGATPILLPTLRIEAIALDAAQRAQLVPDRYDWTIYTSANAVECSLQQLPRPEHSRIAAVGRATARALSAHGLAVHALPATTADSEGLLALAAFHDVRGKRILILKGAGGRPLLREELARRGAEVVTGDVYRRRRATPEPSALAALRDASAAGRAVIAATSAEVLDALLELAPANEFPELRDARLLVPGPRVAAHAGERGWRGPLIVAASAEDAAMAGALCAACGPASPPGAA